MSSSVQLQRVFYAKLLLVLCQMGSFDFMKGSMVCVERPMLYVVAVPIFLCNGPFFVDVLLILLLIFVIL